MEIVFDIIWIYGGPVAIHIELTLSFLWLISNECIDKGYSICDLPVKQVHTSAEPPLLLFYSDNKRLYYSSMELMNLLQIQLCISRDIPNIIFFKGLIEVLV